MKNMTKITFILSLLGVFLLLVISNSFTPKQINIENITNSSLNQNVAVICNITKVINLDNYDFQILTLEDKTGSIKAITNSKKDLEKIDNVIVEGKVIEYNQTLEIEISKIISLSSDLNQ